MTKTTRIAAIAAIFAFAAPTVAWAADGAPNRDLPAEASRGKGKKKGHKKGKRGERPSFPMEADKFMAHVEKRIERVTSRVEKRLERSKMPENKKDEIRAKVAAGTEKIRSAAQNAAADGTVTKDEAKEVREVAREMRKEARKHRKDHRKGKKGKKDRGPRRDARGPGAPDRG
jgi:hypothetical protein